MHSVARRESPRQSRRSRMRETLRVLRAEHVLHLTSGADLSDYVPPKRRMGDSSSTSVLRHHTFPNEVARSTRAGAHSP